MIYAYIIFGILYFLTIKNYFIKEYGSSYGYLAIDGFFVVILWPILVLVQSYYYINNEEKDDNIGW